MVAMNMDQVRQAADFAVDKYVKSGMRIGFGSDTIALDMAGRLAEHLTSGRLQDIAGIATSMQSIELLGKHGIPTTTMRHAPHPDLYFAAPSDVDQDLNFIEATSGSCLRKKILAKASRVVIIVCGEHTQVDQLGVRAPLPIEVAPFGGDVYTDWLIELGCRTGLRLKSNGQPDITEDGNLVYDCLFQEGMSYQRFLGIEPRIRGLPGFVEHGLFCNYGYTFKAIVGTSRNGVQEIEIQVD